MSTFGEGSQGGDTPRVRFRDCWEDRSASQDVKVNGMIGVSSLVR